MINKSIGNIDFAKVLSDGNLLVGCNNEEQASKALKLKEISGVKVVSTSRVGEAGRAKGRKGVICGVPLNIGMEELKSNLKGGMILNAQRMKSNIDGTRKDTEIVMIEFQWGVLQKRLLLGLMSYIVSEYIPRPVRCFN